MKKYYLSFVLLTFSFLSLSQQAFVNSEPGIDKGNCREGESVEYCLTHKKMKERHQKNGQHEKSIIDNEKILLDETLSKVKDGTIEKGVVYTIPVVFHIVHDGGIENISDEQIHDAMDILNTDYRKLNNDANFVVSDFLSIASDSEIEFSLATKSPDGTCFNGITRTRSSMTFDGSQGSAQVDAIVNGNDVYRGDWPGYMYLNVYVLADVGDAAGYTYRPSGNFGATMNAGIFIKNDYVGSFGTANVTKSRALTHEVGHWLGLPHTWGSDNNPGVSSSCTQDDGVEDTPLTIGVTSCSRSSNTCNDLTPSSNVNSSWNYDVVDNVENYMDYSYCSKMFTQGQSDLMRAYLNSNISGRNNLWRSSNLAATGVGESVSLCKADFSVENMEVCSGEQIQFTDLSYSNITAWEWSFPGGSPSTSNLQNPIVQYSSAGTYPVTLKVYSGSASLTEVKSSFLRVLPAAKTLPYFEGFENQSNLSDNEDWSLNELAGARTFTINSNTSYEGDRCLRLSNYYETVPSVDELISSNFDLSSLSSDDKVTLSYRYSYRKKETTDYESLYVFASTDCGSTWNSRASLRGSQLSSEVSSNSWVPSSESDWSTVHVTSINSSYFVNNLRIKFRFTGDGGNNIFLDNINLYEGDPSDKSVVLGLDELSRFKELSLYPNPVANELNIKFTTEMNQDVNINIYDISGKSAQKQLIKAIEGSNLVLLNVEDLSKGLYFVNISSGESNETLQFVVK
jgi:PKD repeat protein